MIMLFRINGVPIGATTIDDGQSMMTIICVDNPYRIDTTSTMKCIHGVSCVLYHRNRLLMGTNDGRVLCIACKSDDIRHTMTKVK